MWGKTMRRSQIEEALLAFDNGDQEEWENKDDKKSQKKHKQ